MYIYLSPSTQEWNIDALGMSEEQLMNMVADAVEPYLKTNGVVFKRNHPSMNVSQVIAQSNLDNYDLYVGLHLNAAPDSAAGRMRGSRVYYAKDSKKGHEAAQKFVDNVKKIYPMPDLVKAHPTTELHEVVQTNAPAVLYEIAFEDNVEDNKWAHDNVQNIAEAVAKSIVEAGGKKFVPMCNYLTPAISYVYSGFMYGQVCNVESVVNVRSQPSTSSEVVAKLTDKTRLLILSDNKDGWVRVRYNDKEGYIFAQYLCVCA